MSAAIEKLWYNKQSIRWLLWPLSLVYRLMMRFRRAYLLRFCQQSFPVPVIVIGNLTVGGVGKTPLLIALAKRMKAKGLSVGVVSRGYGATIKRFPHEVSLEDSATLVGDEPLLIAQKTGCPVVIAPKRVQAVQYLLDKHASQLILSDDGLQHYAMGRAIEIVVIDGLRQLGNGLCLPAGPLREPISRLQQADLMVVNSGQWSGAFEMQLNPGPLIHLKTGQPVEAKHLPSPLAAVAAIGHPQRFFETLSRLGLVFKAYPFPDHHAFCPNELQFAEKAVVMTEKDAVKCRSFAADQWYYLPVEATLGEAFWQALESNKWLQG